MDFQRSVIASLLFVENTAEIPREEAIAHLTERHYCSNSPHREKRETPKEVQGLHKEEEKKRLKIPLPNLSQ